MLSFKKMHGLGNDFVVVDGRASAVQLDSAQIRAIADRRHGVGCDQFILLEATETNGADLFMRIANADGGEVEACGNATRCVADILMNETGKAEVAIETVSGVLPAARADDGQITVDMGVARNEWEGVPLARAMDTLSVDAAAGPLANPTAVGIGNPHAVFFVDDPDTIDLATYGPEIEHHALFPNRTNVEAVGIESPDRLRVRVWERGVGITQACGTGACAAVVAASRRGLSGRQAEVRLDGGLLAIDWRADDHVLMTGPATTVYSGELDLDRLS